MALRRDTTTPILTALALSLALPAAALGLFVGAMPIFGLHMLAVVFAARLPLQWRWLPYTLSALVVTLVAFSRLYLGDGRNSPIRYLRKEVEAYEAARLV